MSNKKIKTSTSDTQGLNLLRMGTLFFAFVSFVTTSHGLQYFVFESFVHAYLVSFAIQISLFVLNLKLPAYRDVQLHAFNQNGDGLKFSLLKKVNLLYIIYILLLSCSAWFSYVFIANDVYEGTKYVDSNIVLSSTYQTILDDTDEYLSESIKYSQITIAEKLSELTMLLPQSVGDITAQLENKKEEKESAEYYIATQSEELSGLNESKLEIANQMEIMQDVHDRYFRQPEYKELQASFEEISDRIQTVEKQITDAENTINALEADIISIEASPAISIKEFLTEILAESPDPVILQQKMTVLNGNVINLPDGIVDLVTFSEIVSKTQQVSIAIDSYITLKSIQNGDNSEENDIESSNVASISELTSRLQSEIIPLPISGVGQESPELGSRTSLQDQHKEWVAFWEHRISSLKQLIIAIPPWMAETSIETNNEIINFDIIRNYDDDGYIETLDDLTRNEISNINELERAFRLFSSRYAFLAYFALFIALLIDLFGFMMGIMIYGKEKKMKSVASATKQSSPHANTTQESCQELEM